MNNEINIPPGLIFACLEVIAKLQKTEQNIWSGSTFTIQRVFGGTNNALYKIETARDILACKVCVDDERQRATREFGALRAIQAACFDIAPKPLLLDNSKDLLPFPVVIYEWVEGKPLKPPVHPHLLENFLDCYHHFHSITPAHFPDFQLTAWFHWFDFNIYREEICEFFEIYTPWLAAAFSDGAELRDRLKQIIDQLSQVITKTEANPSKEAIPLCLVRIDPNTANAIVGNDGCIRWIDWEYSGWGDPALDIAELRWHAALQPLGGEALKWLRANYKINKADAAFKERIKIWDRILATRWPLLVLRALWSNHNGPDRERLSRVETLSSEYFQRLCNYVDRAEALFIGKDLEVA